MFVRWLNTRLKAAQRALDEGRIDEALGAATAADVRDQSDWQPLMEQLGRALLARARLHLQSGRYSDALLDLDRLEPIGRVTPDSRTLRDRVLAELRQHTDRTAERQADVQRAEQELKAGRLESGRLAIERVQDAGRREDLKEELEYRVRRTGELLQQAEIALKQGDILTAIRFWRDAGRRHGQTREMDSFALRCSAALRGQLEQWFDEGQLARLLGARESLEGMRAVDPALAEYQRWIGLADHAASRLAARDYVSMRQTLLRLKAARGQAKWLSEAIDASARAVEALDLLLASPLGACSSHRPPTAAGEDAPDEPASAMDVRTASASANVNEKREGGDRLLILVDGGGSALLVSRKLVRVGRLGADVDVPFPADVQSHHADVECDGDDYFLIAYGPAFVNQRRMTRTLLRDGDRVLLGARAKFVFSKPSAKSATAVLRLSHSSRLPQDVSEVVLFRDTCLIGPRPSCHIRTREGENEVIVFDRDGRLMARPADPRGRRASGAHALEFGRPMEFGDVRVTVKPYEARQC
jgi:hypothetical protein